MKKPITSKYILSYVILNISMHLTPRSHSTNWINSGALSNHYPLEMGPYFQRAVYWSKTKFVQCLPIPVPSPTSLFLLLVPPAPRLRRIPHGSVLFPASQQWWTIKSHWLSQWQRSPCSCTSPSPAIELLRHSSSSGLQQSHSLSPQAALLQVFFYL